MMCYYLNVHFHDQRVKHRGIGVTIIKSSLFIPPGQDYCAKDTSVGKMAECKLNDLGSVLIP